MKILRWSLSIVAGVALLLAVWVVVGRFAPVPSTLMLGRWITGQAVSRQWRPLAEISPALVAGVIAAEDQRYCAHAGVDFIALRDVLDDEDGPARGASTVTMQVAKNVFLWPGRSYLRKALEIPLALTIDLVWGKTRVMEVYLNIAEWGEGVFGAEAAARRYFGKSAATLDRGEAARLVAILPNPLRRAPGAGAASRRVERRMAASHELGTCVIR